MSYAVIVIALVVLLIALASSVSGTVNALQALILVTKYVAVFLIGVSLKTSVYSLTIILFAVGAIYLVYKMASPLYDDAVRIETFIKNRHQVAGDFRTAAAYIRVSRELNNRAKLQGNDENILRALLDQYRAIFDNLPESHPIQTRDNTLGFHKRTQLKLLRISQPRQSILFILHEEKEKDASVAIADFERIPSAAQVMTIVGGSVPEDHIRLGLQNLDKGMKGEISIHTKKGYGLTGEPSTSRWAYAYLPNPLLGFDFRGMLADYLNLDSLID